MAMTLISSQVLSTSAASVTFSSIPQTFKSLRLVVSARNDISATNDYGLLQFNNDTGTTSTFTHLQGNGTSTGSQAGSFAGILSLRTTAATATANTFGSNTIDIPNYTGSTVKAVTADGVSENNATQAVQSLWASLWSGTAAITSMSVKPGSGSFVAGSSFTLYGIK